MSYFALVYVGIFYKCNDHIDKGSKFILYFIFDTNKRAKNNLLNKKMFQIEKENAFERGEIINFQ